MNTAELSAKIRELARSRDAVILAHNYTHGEVQDVADFVGGLQAGGYAESDFVAGAQVAIVCRADELAGLQIGVANICLDLDDFSNAGDMAGAQIGVVNVCNRGAGLQVGVWNHAKHFKGVQLGLVNVIEDHEIPFLPVLNVGF